MSVFGVLFLTVLAALRQMHEMQIACLKDILIVTKSGELNMVVVRMIIGTKEILLVRPEAIACGVDLSFTADVLFLQIVCRV